MTAFIDVHCHLSNNYFFKSIDNYLKLWHEKNISYIVSVSENYKESLRSLQLADKYSEIIPAVGIHPWKAHKKITELEKFENLLEKNKEIKILGEIGLDYHFISQKERYQFQKEILEFFFDIAEKNDLRLMLHVKGAEEDILNFIESSNVQGNHCCIHWFSGTNPILKKLIDSDCYFSCGPALSYSSRHQQVPKTVPLNRLLTESDGNVKYKGEIGHPGLMPKVVRMIADLVKNDYTVLQNILYENSLKYLGI